MKSTIKSIILLIIIALSFTSCSKEEYVPVVDNPTEINQNYPIIIRPEISDVYYSIDSTDNYAVENHINSIYIEHIRFYENKIIIEHYVSVLFKIKIIGYTPQIRTFSTRYEFEIHKNYLEYELNLLETLKETQGNISIIENATIKSWQPNPNNPFHGWTKCWVTDSQIEYIINTINENI